MLKILVLLMVGQIAYGQIYTKPNNSYGLIWNRGRFDSAAFFPTRCGVPASLVDLRSTDQNMMALQYDSCSHKLYLWDPALKSWLVIGGGTDSSWKISGNANTDPSNFIGTTDERPVRFRTNNVERVIIDSATGRVWIIDGPDTLTFIAGSENVIRAGPGTTLSMATDGAVLKVGGSDKLTITGLNNGGDPTTDSLLVQSSAGPVKRMNTILFAKQKALEDTSQSIRSAIIGTNLGNTPAPTSVDITSSTGSSTTLPAATFSQAGVFTSRDKQMLDSAFRAFKSSYSGDTSLVFWTAILRPSWGGIATGDTLRWNLLGIGDDHDTLYVTSVSALSDGKLSIRYPHISRVLLSIANVDETLASRGVLVGFSSGLDSSVLTMAAPSTPNNLTSSTGNGTGWGGSLFVWAAGTTTLTPGGGYLGGFDAYAGSVEYIGTNNYRVKYVVAGVSNLTVKFQLWDNITNTLVTTAPTSSDIVLYRRPIFPIFVNCRQFASSGLQASIFGASLPNQTSGSNIWVFGVGKRTP